MQKNVASQKWVVFAFDRTDNTPVTGDAANITANLRIDGGAADAVDDTNPTELEDGFYVFDLTQAETNGDYILISPASTTADVQVIGCPAAVFTTPPNFNDLGIESDGDITKVNTLDGHTAQTGDSYAEVTNGTYGLSAIEALVDDLESRLTAARAGYLDELGAANLPADIDTLLGRLTALRAGYLDNLNISENVAGVSDISGLNDPSAADVADAVWDEARSGHVAGGSFGETMGTVETNIDNCDAPISTVDTAVDAIQAVTDNLPNSGALTDIDSGVNNIEAKLPSKAYLAGSADADGGIDSTEAGVLADAVLDEVVEGAYTLRQLIRIIVAALAGKLSGAATTTITIRDTGDSTDRIIATVDADGNRSSVTLDGD